MKAVILCKVEAIMRPQQSELENDQMIKLKPFQYQVSFCPIKTVDDIHLIGSSLTAEASY